MLLVSQKKRYLYVFILVEWFLFASPPPRGPLPGADGICHKASPTCPAEFIETGTLLQSSNCSDKWQFSNENLPH